MALSSAKDRCSTSRAPAQSPRAVRSETIREMAVGTPEEETISSQE